MAKQKRKDSQVTKKKNKKLKKAVAREMPLAPAAPPGTEGAPAEGAASPEEQRVLERKLKKERKKEARRRLQEAGISVAQSPAARRSGAALALDYLCRRRSCPAALALYEAESSRFLDRAEHRLGDIFRGEHGRTRQPREAPAGSAVTRGTALKTVVLGRGQRTHSAAQTALPSAPQGTRSCGVLWLQSSRHIWVLHRRQRTYLPLTPLGRKNILRP
ncbi:protein cholesin isoform X2 [Tursiops truncatus]